MDSNSSRSSRAKKSGGVLLCSRGLTFALLRAYLHFSPDTDLNIGHCNIHHLFTGLLLIAVGGIPLAILKASTPGLKLARGIFGAGLGMALDEWVYLIATASGADSEIVRTNQIFAFDTVAVCRQNVP